MHVLFNLLGLCLLAQSVLGQSTGRDSSPVTTAARQAVDRYDQVSATLEHLYDGPEYISYDRRLTGHAFFPTDTMQDGMVFYEGRQFAVPLLYDIVKDVVVVVHTSGYRIALHSDRVERFSLKNHLFIRIDSIGQNMPEGFYDLLYDGPTQLLARRKKNILVNPNSFGYGIYDPKTTYYLRKNGRYFQAKNKRGLLTLLADRRKELASFARRQKLSFRPSPETAFLKLAQQYDELTKPL
ncbi:hypothetical protein [Fibrella forsythiae]|uniref:Uncharacterized protein n=1 Tax=Fibrella forsythiae TaxID=2817061 RepID=A0ABS3JCT1_9BACT|nr:hypothetical protein [Fibrella forsythiae]MBO0947797.1 hypothetical protein [Fibrella forsythiae]